MYIYNKSWIMPKLFFLQHYFQLCGLFFVFTIMFNLGMIYNNIDCHILYKINDSLHKNVQKISNEKRVKMNIEKKIMEKEDEKNDFILINMNQFNKND